jgi:hypothetical protein
MRSLDREQQIYEKRDPARLGVAVVAGILAFSALAFVVDARSAALDRGFYGLLAVFCIVIGVRAIRSGVIVQTDDLVIVRQTHWTHRLRRTSVRRFSGESGTVRSFGRRGRWFLVVELANGDLRAFKDFNAPRNVSGEQEIERVAAALNSSWHLN